MTRHTARSIALTLALGLILGPAGAFAQGLTERFAKLYSDPGEFTLFGDTDNEIISYERPRDVRICVQANRHAVGLDVKYDKQKALVRPGNCFEFEAKRVVISPAKPLDDAWTLHGTVQTRGRG